MVLRVEACPTQAITYEDVAVGDWIGDFAAQRTARVLARAEVA